MIEGFQTGYRFEDPHKPFDRSMARRALEHESGFKIRMENKDDCEGGDWYDIIAVPRIVNKEYK